jgi:hypothetical protein
MTCVGKVGKLVLPRAYCFILLQHVWYTANCLIFLLRQIIVPIYIHVYNEIRVEQICTIIWFTVPGTCEVSECVLRMSIASRPCLLPLHTHLERSIEAQSPLLYLSFKQSNSIQFNSIQFFILTCSLRSFKNQLHSQHKKDKCTTNRNAQR